MKSRIINKIHVYTTETTAGIYETIERRGTETSDWDQIWRTKRRDSERIYEQSTREFANNLHKITSAFKHLI